MCVRSCLIGGRGLVQHPFALAARAPPCSGAWVMVGRYGIMKPPLALSWGGCRGVGVGPPRRSAAGAPVRSPRVRLTYQEPYQRCMRGLPLSPPSPRSPAPSASSSAHHPDRRLAPVLSIYLTLTCAVFRCRFLTAAAPRVRTSSSRHMPTCRLPPDLLGFPHASR